MPEGFFDVTNELLVDLLHLPAGTVVVWASMTADGRDVRLTVSHPDIKAEKNETAKLMPMFDKNIPGLFAGWGQD